MLRAQQSLSLHESFISPTMGKLVSQLENNVIVRRCFGVDIVKCQFGTYRPSLHHTDLSEVHSGEGSCNV